MAKVRIAFKNVLDKRATYRLVEGKFLDLAAIEYARLYCEDPELYHLVMQEKVHIRLNGKIVEVDDWHATPLRDDDKILITPVLEGDFLGGGGMLGIILGAVLIVAAAFTGGASLMLLGVAFNQTLFLMGAAMVLGGLASMFMTPDLPTLSSGSLTSSGSTTYSWSGISTQARPDKPVPVVYGKHIVGGNLISVFTERQGSDDYLYMLIALGEGIITGICTEADTDVICTTTDRTNAAYKHPHITLDDQPFKNYTDIEWWYRNGTNSPNAAVEIHDPSAQNLIPHFSGSRMQMDDGRPLTQDGIIYTTTKEVDMTIVQVKFPSMFDATGGSVSETTVTYKIQYRKNGDATWYDYNRNRYDLVVTPQERSPGVMTPSRSWSPKYSTSVPGLQQGGAYALTDEAPDDIFVEVTKSSTTDLGTPSGSGDGSYDYWYPTGTMNTNYTLTVKNLSTDEMWNEVISYSTPVQWVDTTGGEDYAVKSGYWKSIGATTTNNQRLTLGPYDVIAPGSLKRGDKWIFSSTRSGQAWQTINAKSKTGFWDTSILDFHALSNGEGKQVYDLRIMRQNPLSSDFNVSNQAVLNSVIEVVNGDFIYPNTAILGFRIRATDQLSGSPPNMNVMIKGLKIDVPDHSGSESFEDLFYDSTDGRWEYDGAERTWDNTTYLKEYSNNSMLCLKDLMTNKIYGLGEYTNNEDFNDANTIAIVKECHIEYTPTEGDYVKWWGAGNDAEFVKSIEDGMSSLWEKTLTISASSSTVAYADSYAHWVPFRLDAPLKNEQRYRFSITLSGLSHNVDIDIAVARHSWIGSGGSGIPWFQLGDYTTPEISDAGNGVHTYDFTAQFSGITAVVIRIVKNGEPVNISGTITDISLNSIQGSGSNRAWHYHTFNGVFDTKQAALAALLEFTNAFRVWPSWYEGTFKFIMDKDETPIHTLSLSNTISFSQSWVPLSEIPYRIVAQFADEDQKYAITQIMVQSTDTTLSKANEQTIGLKGITNRKRAEREVKFRLTKLTNSTHSVQIRCGMDMIHATAGDIINVSNDLPQWGHGSRIASYNEGNKFVYLTEPYTVTDATPADVMIKYQDINNDFQTATLNITGISDGDILRRLTLESWPTNPNINGPAAIGISTSYVKKFRLLAVTRSSDEEVEVDALEHIDTIYGSEPTLTVQQDYETNALDVVVGKPTPPINVEINPLLPTEGIGWDISAEHGDLKSQEIIVEMGIGSSANSFDQIGTIVQGQTSMRYINNNLQTGESYTFRLYAKSQLGTSSSVYQTVRLEKYIYQVTAPTGLNIKGSDPLTQTWDGLDVTIAWNPTGQDWYRSGLMDFYSLYIYHTSYDPQSPNTNLLRTAYPKKTEYKYTYDMNLEDNGTSIPKGTLIFIVTANLINGTESARSRPFKVANANPNTPQNFTSNVSLRTVTFKWSPVEDTDFKTFRMRSHLKNNAGTPISAWSDWEDKTSNSFNRFVNGTEIGVYGNLTRVFAEVKTVDLYNGSSNVASGNNVTESLGVTLGTQTVASWMIADDAIVNIKLIASAITSRTVATGAITSEAIVAGAIVTDKLFASAVTTNKIETNGIVAAKIAANAVIANKINANAVSAAKINVATLSAIAGNMGVLTAGVAKSADGRLLIDFDNKYIKIFDAASQLRVQLGSIP